MYLNRLRCYTPFSRLAHPGSIRMASTIVGNSGRVYVQGEVLQRHREDHKLSVFKAKSGKVFFVFKRVPRPFYDRSLRLAAGFEDSRRLRMHIDYNHDDCILIYPYFRSTLLALIQGDPDFPPAERPKILRHVGEAIQQLHSKDWIHLDVKPDNILVNWTHDKDGNKIITDAALGDFDIAIKCKKGESLQTPYAVGNAMWRSPEGQTGKGMTKASDIFSFGLVCIYALGGGDFLLINDYQDFLKMGITPEQEILTRHFCYFGPVSDGLLKQINNENWSIALRGASKAAEEMVKEQPELKFENWGKDLRSETQDMISGMMNPDPTARMTINQVLMHASWQEEAT